MTEVILTPACPMVEMTVDLGGGEAMTVAGRRADPSTRARSAETCDETETSWPIDWSDLTTSSSGHEAHADNVDLVVVARYDMVVEALEQSFAERDSLAAVRYTLAVQGQTSADLADAKTEGGQSFSGFIGEGFWLLELRDTDATLDVPVYLSVVESS